MADTKSPFLKWQDEDNDGLIDVCDDLIEEIPVPCGDKCTPNPLAIVPAWRQQKSLEPWLNEKSCYYQIVKVTPYTSTVPTELIEGDDVNEQVVNSALGARAAEFVDEIIETFLEVYDKEDTPESRNKIRNELEFYKYDIKARKTSHLKLLFQIPFKVIDELPQATEDGESDEDQIGWTSVEFLAGDFSTKLIRVRRGLYMHSRYLKVFRALEGGNIKFWEDDSLFDLESYGDAALFTENSIIALLQNDLESYLNGLGFQIPGIGSGFRALFSTWDRVLKIRFQMKDYELKQITLWTEGCAEKPFFLNKKLRRLKRSAAWKDKTALAYLNSLYKMDAALQARVPMPWQDFVTEFTYPKVYSTITDDDSTTGEDIYSCISDALAAEGKELGQDILDEVFSIGDVIAYKFKQSLCRFDKEEWRDDDAKLGLTQVLNPSTGKAANIGAMAKMQAFKKLQESDQVFVTLCARVLASALGWKNADKQMDALYEYGFERIKVCGLFDLALDAIKCLMGGLTLEQALSRILKSALQAMNMENFGDLFIGLPPEKQAQLDALVKKKFEEGELFRPDSEMQNYSDAIDAGGVKAGAGASPGERKVGADGSHNDSYGQDDTPFFGDVGTQKFTKPWEDQEIIDKERLKDAKMDYASANARRSLADQVTTGGAGGEDKLNQDLVMDLYIEGLIEVYADNMLELLDELNKFPGAELIAFLIALFDCPMPPLLNPSIADFMKGFGLPFCQDLRELKVPRFWDPSEWYPDFVDLMKNLWDLIKMAIKQAIINILMLILMKICQILGDAICKALGTVGKIAASLPALATGRKQLLDIIKESICGPEATDEMVENTLTELMGSLGQGGAALANQDAVMGWAGDLSSSVTRREFAEAFLGQASPDFLEVADQLIEFEYPEFRDGFRDHNAIGQFFKNVGNLMPAQVRQDLSEFLGELPEGDAFPANPSLCLTEQQLEDFADLRCEILAGKASPEQCRTMFDNMQGSMVDDLGELTDLMQKGVEETIMNNLPKMFSEPGCDDGLIPDMPAPTKNVAVTALSNDFEMLKIDYSKDMLGNGGLFATDKGWGLMNLALSDTLGNPLTAHHRFSRNRKRYVNFASNLPNGGESTTGFFSFLQGNAGFSSQEGQFPSYVGEWLMRQFLNAGGVSGDLDTLDPTTGADYNLWPIKSISSGGNDLEGGNTTVGMNSMTYNSSNDWEGDNEIRVTWEELDFDSAFIGQNVDLTRVPDFGYNTPISVDYDSREVIILEKGRKKSPDMVLDYKDNAKGLRKSCDRGTNPGGQSEWSYGFEIHYFSNDLVDDLSFDSSGEESKPVDMAGGMPDGEHDLTKEMSPEDLVEYEAAIESKNPEAITNTQDGVVRNRADDNVRIKIIEKVNTDARVESPLSELTKDELQKSDGFDLPSWIENIPLVGWTLQALVNMMTKPFSSLIRAASSPATQNVNGESLIINEKYEFLAVDNGLDGIDLTEYPNFVNCFTTQNTYSPPVVLLSDLTGISTSEAKTQIDTWTNQFYKDMSAEIGTNQAGWKYGAKFDYLMPSDADYLAPVGHEYEGQPYQNIMITDARTGEPRSVRNKDMVLGVSRDQYINEINDTPENTRVYYLNPAQYGGSYTSPPIHVKPIQFSGWLGLIQVLFPQMSPCKPQRTDLIDFGEIQEKIDQRITKIPEDPRLKHDPDCALEVPYNRILDRAGKTGLMGVIEAAIRIYASSHFFKAIGTFSKIQPKFPDNFSNIYTQYIVEVMEEKFKESQHAFWEMFNPFKDEEFWYAFLEQSVQFYAWRLEEGEIQNPPASVLNALGRLNNYQEDYKFAYENDLLNAKAIGDANIFQTLKSYRQDKNYEAIQATEEDAKLILAELVGEQLTLMGNRLVDNLRAQGYIPTIFDLDYWVFENQCGGSAITIAGPEFVEEPQGLPRADWIGDSTETSPAFPGPYYTSGGQFRVAEDNDSGDGYELNDEYIGYYIGTVDENGDVIYLAGEAVTDDADILRPVAELVKVGSLRITTTTDERGYGTATPPPGASETRRVDVTKKEVVYLGDVAEYGDGTAEGKPFILEKFVSINGSKMKPSAAEAIVKAKGSALLISEVYPGTLQHVMSPAGAVVGLDGELGVRYGIQFYYAGGGSKIPIADVAVDSLDLRCSEFAPFDGDSKMLLCLLNMLKQHPKYRMLTGYIFPLKKVTATLAMYNDLGFLSAIGEVTVGRGDYDRWVPMSKGIFASMSPGPEPDSQGDWINSTNKGVQAKPGSIAFLNETSTTEDIPDPYWGKDGMMREGGGDETYTIMIKTLDAGKSLVGGNEGWVAYKNRKKGLFGGIGVLEWDNWDRVILRNSTSRIKKMFKGYYNSRTWIPGDMGDFKPGQLWIENMKARMMPNPAMGILPWFRRRKVRPNPFNAKGEMCDGPTK